MSLTKSDRRNRIQRRIRKIITGTLTSPRLSVFRSNKEIYAQIIDDESGKTIVAASSREKEIVEKTMLDAIRENTVFYELSRCEFQIADVSIFMYFYSF